MSSSPAPVASHDSLPTASDHHRLRTRRLALFGLFFITGIDMSSWVTRTPAVRDLLDASTGRMGIVLGGLSIGSMIAILTSGPAVRRFGARRMVAVTSVGLVLGMPLVALGAATGSAPVVMCGLFCFGIGVGGGEIPINIEGARVEQESGRSFLPAMHGCFSAGTVLGAVCGILANTQDLPVTWHLVIAGVLTLVLVVWAIPQLPEATGKVTGNTRERQAGSGASPSWRDARLIMIGGIVLAVALAEGTANDWLPLVMVDGHGLDPTLGSAVFALFAASMTIGRFAGGPVVRHLGRPVVLGASAGFAALGLASVALLDNPVLATIAVVVWGLGTSLGFPLAISAAGDSGPDSAARVSAAGVVGYVAFLVGPPVLGLVGDHIGLRGALLLPMIVVALAILLSPAARTTAPAEDPDVPDAAPAPEEDPR